MPLAVPDMLCTAVSCSEALQLILEFSYPSHPTNKTQDTVTQETWFRSYLMHEKRNVNKIGSYSISNCQLGRHISYNFISSLNIEHTWLQAQICLYDQKDTYISKHRHLCMQCTHCFFVCICIKHFQCSVQQWKKRIFKANETTAHRAWRKLSF